MRDTRPLFEPMARADSMFPVTEASAQSQCVRWQHVHIATLLLEVPRPLHLALRSGDARLAGMALDLMALPIPLLLGLVVFAMVDTLAGLLPALLGRGVGAREVAREPGLVRLDACKLPDLFSFLMVRRTSLTPAAVAIGSELGSVTLATVSKC